MDNFNEIDFDETTMTKATAAEVSLVLWKIWKGETMSRTTKLDRLFDLRGELLDKKYHDCQLAIISDGYYVESDLPVTQEIAAVTTRIHALEDELRAQEQDAEIQRDLDWLTDEPDDDNYEMAMGR
jgi:hypothetical protein